MNNKRQEFSYGAMGEVIGNIRTFALPNESNTYTFAMSFEYDSWNRILTTTYPDGEFVRYWYNKGGQLRKMAGSYNNVNYNYIDSVYYNKFEKRTKICYGNGTKAEYTYDILQRLVHLKSISGSGIMQEIDYTFDNVNNIERVTNYAGVLSNGLGGKYDHRYSYDNLYRITRSTGNWENNNTNLSYGLDMSYEEDGRIKTKYQNGTTLINGVQSGFSYRNVYTYNTNQQQHTIRNVYDNQNNLNQDFQWDANGNLTFHKTQYPNSITRKLCWDEENRLMAVGDNKYTSYYVYDNGGERTYKLTGPNTLMNINGNWMNFAYMDNPTLYTSAYLVANIQGYTKHYYAGSERIASAIGLGGLATINKPITLMSYEHKWENKSKALNAVMTRTIEQCLNHRFISKKTLANLYNLKVATSGTMNRYFYHPDHLGSSSWITDGSGNAIQHLHYLPFGEDWVDQRNSSWNTPYTFSGKEKDVETGYGYFGARYYDSGLSIWLSVDPMSDKYPSMSPYNYCANNPVILVDPDGREIDPYLIFNGDKKLIEIFDDNNTPDDYSDDVFVGAYDAHNNVDRSSNGKWEDGIYEMEDKTTAHTHGEQTDDNGVKKDSKNGAYGENGCFRAKTFKETKTNLFRTGMAVHAGRENKSFLNRVTMGCIRVTPEAMDAIQAAIDKYGSLNRIIIQNNRKSDSSSSVNEIDPLKYNNNNVVIPFYHEKDNTRVNTISTY